MVVTISAPFVIADYFARASCTTSLRMERCIVSERSLKLLLLKGSGKLNDRCDSIGCSISSGLD